MYFSVIKLFDFDFEKEKKEEKNKTKKKPFCTNGILYI
jgi:hypothetical protein